MPSAPDPGRVSAFGLLVAALSAGQEQEPPHVLPRVETSRVVLEARVTDSHGRPFPGLGPDDFPLKVDGHATPLESAVWVAESPNAPRALPSPGTPGRRGPVLPPRPRGGAWHSLEVGLHRTGGEHRIHLALAGRGGTVLTRTRYVD